MPDQKQLETWDRENFFHPSTHLAQFARGEATQRLMTGGEGVFIKDAKGTTLLDAFAGLYCVNIGYGRKEVIEAIAEQARSLAYYHSYVGHGTEASITLAKMVLDRAPKSMSKVYFGLSGSDANETNIKLVWFYNNILGRPNKKKIISRWRGYHGSGLISGSMTGLELFHHDFDLPLDRIFHTEAPYYYRRAPAQEEMSEAEFSMYCAKQLEDLIQQEGPETIAAFIAEPALGTGGLVPPPEGYWDAIQPILQHYDIIIIADEVVTGFGRLGSMFGSTHYGLRPDLITIAKGLTSAYIPLSGSIVSSRIYEVLMQGTDKLGPIGHGWTYSAHPVATAAGVANLRLVDEMKLVQNAAEIGIFLKNALQEALGNHPKIGEIRGEGLLLAVEFVQDRANRSFFEANHKVGATVAANLLKEGVIGRAMPQGDILGLAPPLCLSQNEALQIVDSLVRAVERTF